MSTLTDQESDKNSQLPNFGRSVFGDFQFQHYLFDTFLPSILQTIFSSVKSIQSFASEAHTTLYCISSHLNNDTGKVFLLFIFYVFYIAILIAFIYVAMYKVLNWNSKFMSVNLSSYVEKKVLINAEMSNNTVYETCGPSNEEMTVLSDDYTLQKLDQFNDIGKDQNNIQTRLKDINKETKSSTNFWNIKAVVLVLLYWTIEQTMAGKMNKVLGWHLEHCNDLTQSNRTQDKHHQNSFIFCEMLTNFAIAFPYSVFVLLILAKRHVKFCSILLLSCLFTLLFALCKLPFLLFFSYSLYSTPCNVPMQGLFRTGIALVSLTITLIILPVLIICNKHWTPSIPGGGLAKRYFWKSSELETYKQRNFHYKEYKSNSIHHLKENSPEASDVKKDMVIPGLISNPSPTKREIGKVSAEAFVPCVVLIPKNKSNKGGQVFAQNSLSNKVVGTSIKLQSHNRMRRRFSLDIEHRMKKMEDDVLYASRHSGRRTSLPSSLLSSRKKIVMTSVLVESGTIAEVHTVLRDLVTISNGSPEINQYVTKLQKLLKPYQTEHVRPSQVVWLHDSLSTSDGSDDEDVNKTGRQAFPKRAHREWSRESSLWTTTTSATGLPSKDPGPVKPIRLPISKTPRCSSPICISKEPGPQRRRNGPLLSPVHSSKNFFKHLESMVPLSDDSGCHETNHTDSSECDLLSAHNSDVSPVGHPQNDKTLIMHGKTHAKDEIEMESSLIKSGKMRMLVTEPTIDEGSEEDDECSKLNLPLKNTRVADDLTSFDACSQGADSGRLSANIEHNHGENYFDSTRYHGVLLEQVPNWNFPIFSFADKTYCVLSQMAYKLFDDTGLFHIFKIPRHLFVNYMRALENGYRNIPYHNRIHAADVLHGCWYLTTQQVHGFHQHSRIFGSESSDSDSGTSTIQSERHQVNNIGHSSLATAIPALELMALYLAAAMHDYDHPGRTNAFLVETRHPLAMLYNDRSVLENHHASASWELLHSRNDGAFDFLQNLKTAEWKRLRFLIVEAILATDLKKHFELVNKFTSRITKQRPSSQSSEASVTEEISLNGINWSKDEDRLLVCQMVIKLADISGPTKSRNLHVTWTKAICEEFFCQGDEERRREIPLSLYMDRNEPKVAALQRTFIKNLIDPLVKAMHTAGILAGKSEETEYESDGQCSEILGSSPSSTSMQTKNILLSQLSSNSRHWKLMEDKKLPGMEEIETAFSSAVHVKLQHDGFPQLPILTSEDTHHANEVHNSTPVTQAETTTAHAPHNIDTNKKGHFNERHKPETSSFYSVAPSTKTETGNKVRDIAARFNKQDSSPNYVKEVKK